MAWIAVCGFGDFSAEWYALAIRPDIVRAKAPCEVRNATPLKLAFGVPAELSASVILVRQANWRNIAGGSPANESPNQAHFPRALHGCSRGQT